MEAFLSINLGNVLTILSFIVGGLVFAVTVRSDVRFQGERLIGIEDELKKLREVVVTIARQEERMNAMDERMMMQGARIDKQTDRMNIIDSRTYEYFANRLKSFSSRPDPINAS